MKIFLVIIILFLTGCSKTIYVDNEEEIENNSIVFIKKELSTSILIKKDGIYSLVELNNEDKIYDIELDFEINNLILLEDVITNIEYDYKYILEDSVLLNDIKISKSDKIEIDVEKNKFCVYDKDVSEFGDYSSCDFIYILNNEENVYIKLNNNMKVLFYNEYVNFSSKFLEHLYTTWIDSYIINDDVLTVLTIEGNDFIVKNVENDVD